MAADSPPDPLQVLLRHACAELRSKLQAGQSARAETFLEAHPTLASHPDFALELILTEVVVRRDLGTLPDPQEVLSRFPQWEEPLRRQLSVLRLLDGWTLEPTTPGVNTDLHVAAAGPGQIPEVPELGPHERLERIGGGGMGDVYRARDLVLDREVALKVLRPEAGAEAEMLERFHREARAAARLRHPHIVPVHAIGRCAGEFCYTMPLFGRGSLDRHKARYSDDPRAAVTLIEKVARAVHAAHQAGIIHRDLKPGNILLDDAGEPLVADFGLAKLADGADVTQTGRQMGTPAYMAPEQAAGHSVRATPASDVWSLGVILFELLTGRRPFAGKDPTHVIRLVRLGEPPRPRKVRPGLPRDLEAVLLCCLEKPPARRYSSAEELADDLGRWLRGEPVRARPPSVLRRIGRTVRRHALLTAASLLGALAVTAAMLYLHLRDPDRQLAQIESRLARGESVTLIGETGLPAWSHWCFGQGAIVNPRQRDGTFTFSTFDPALLELVRQPPDSYRFSAEVYYSEPKRSGNAGLFLAYSRTAGDGISHHCYCTWGFNAFARFPPGPGQAEATQRVEFWVCRCARPVGGDHAVGLHMHTFPAGELATAPVWRRLAVEARPDSFQLLWEGEPVGKGIPWDKIRAVFPDTRRELKDGVVVDLFPDLSPPFGPQQHLGVYVEGGEASFRNVAIQPLP